MIYIHVPFCRSFCTYCGFYSEICSKDNGTVERYASALHREIDARKDEIMKHAQGGRNTLYIGGGTPSVLPLSFFSSLMDHLSTVLGGRQEWEEFTVEVNPDDIVRGGLEYAEGLKAAGVTRVSMGVQSFDDSVLKWMNRRHSAADAERAFAILREAGFDNLSLDLIFGFGAPSAGTSSDQASFSDWEASVQKALALRPEHISAYQLSIEPDSALERQIANGRFKEADEELCRSQYDYLCSALREAGYVHYEVSNFALPGREARHNSGYWDHSPYVGLGPAAHSLAPASDSLDSVTLCRSWNAPDLSTYLSTYPNTVAESAAADLQVGSGHSSVESSRESETLTAEQLAIEDVMLGLRTAAGLPSARLHSICARYASSGGCVDQLLAEGALVLLPNGNVRIPEDHFFVSDDIIRTLCVE